MYVIWTRVFACAFMQNCELLVLSVPKLEGPVRLQGEGFHGKYRVLWALRRMPTSILVPPTIFWVFSTTYKKGAFGEF